MSERMKQHSPVVPPAGRASVNAAQQEEQRSTSPGTPASSSTSSSLSPTGGSSTATQAIQLSPSLWVMMEPSLLSTALTAEALQANLQQVLSVLSSVAQQLRPDEQLSFDAVVRVLTTPALLHHENKRVQALAIECLRQVIRICKLDNLNYETDRDLSPPISPAVPDEMATRESYSGSWSLSQRIESQAQTREDKDESDNDVDADSDNDGKNDNDTSDDMHSKGHKLNLLPFERSPSAIDPRLWLTAGGEMSKRICEKDWSATPLGPISEWPHALNLALTICLFSRFPFVIFWGPEYRILYNDAYIPVMADKHPVHIGSPYSVCWPTLWDHQQLLLDAVVNSRRANWTEDHYNCMDRKGFLEECYFTYSYCPIFLEDNSVGGVYTAVTETTARVIGERQLRTLRDISARGAEAESAKAALRITADVISTSGRWDIAFANLYLLDDAGKNAVLEETVGIQRGSLLSPEVVTIPRFHQGNKSGSSSGSSESSPEEVDDEQGGFWCSFFHEVISTHSAQTLDLIPFGSEVPPSIAWNDQPRNCIILPIISPTNMDKVVGVFVAGTNPRHAFDENDRVFFHLFTGHVASAVTNAISREEERKRAESLAELDRAKTTFFSNISHEFRTPLTLMLGPLEDLMQNAELQIEKQQLTLIHRNALRLYKLVNSLLDFSRLEAGRARAVYEPVDLSAFTQDLASIFRSATERAGLDLLVDCSELDQPVYVDKDMWEKIVLNLLSNALKFTMHGYIRISTKALSETHAELAVQDTGIGIPAEEIPLLGKRFHRVQTPGGRSHEGTGIGLALVYELVRLHGGTVSAESKLGKGTTFRVRIPFGTQHLPTTQLKRIVRTLPSHFSEPKSTTEISAPASSQGAKDEGAALSDASHYSKTASWWLPSISIVSATSSSSHTSSMSSSTSSSSSSASSSPSISQSPTSSSPSSSSPEMPSSPRSRTAASFSIYGDKSRKRHKKKRNKSKKATILLADDNFDMREYVARLLSSKYDVISVANGLEALSVLRSGINSIELVLTDVMMPFLDGFGLLKELRSRAETRMLPVIMLSARAGEEASAEGLEEGADDYLIKPFTARELLSRIASHLRMARMRTEAMVIERDLRTEVSEAKDRLERILASIQDAFISLDSKLRFTYVNRNAARLLSAKQEDMLGHIVWRYMVDTEDRVVRRNLERAVKDRMDLVFDYHYSTHNRWYETRIYPGSDNGVTMYTIDVTARKKSEHRLALVSQIGRLLSASVESHWPSLLASALKIIAEGSLLADWCVMDVVNENNHLQRIATPNAAVHLWQMHKITDKANKKFWSEIELCNGERVGIECDLTHTSHFVVCYLQGRDKVFGTWIFARHPYHHTAFEEEDIALCEELARRASMAIDNALLYREAESANNAKDHFLAALSHELRTPLTPALLLSESLLGENLSHHVEENVRMIHESVELEVQLIDDLLDLTKIARNKLELHLQEVAVHELLGRTLQIVGHEIHQKKLHVSTDLSAHLDRLNADPARLQQVFWNIVKNAIKFTPEGGNIVIRTSNYEDTLNNPALDKENQKHAKIREMKQRIRRSIDVSALNVLKEEQAKEKDDNKRLMLQVDIIDTGIGIEEHVLPALFRAFEQGDASITVRFGGLGLGLSISRSLVEMHHGTLSASSQGRNKGATFTVRLPTCKPTAPAESCLLLSKSSGEVKTFPSHSSSMDTITTESFSSRPDEGKIPKSRSGEAPGAVDATSPRLNLTSPNGSPPLSPRSAAQMSSSPLPKLEVLLVEDNKSTVMIMSRLLQQKLNCSVVVALSMEDALRAADKADGAFDLVISDIGLPDGSGLDLMSTLKSKYRLRGIALSGYGMDEDVQRSVEAGFELHLTKPVHFSSLAAAIHSLFNLQAPPSPSQSSPSRTAPPSPTNQP